MKNRQFAEKLALGFGLILFLGTGLSCSSKRERPNPSDIPDEVSMKEDQDKINEVRKEVPAEKISENDRLSQMLKRWSQVRMKPEELRERFENELRKSRVQFEKRLTKKRDDFNEQVKKQREEFRDQAKEDRDDFKGSKVSQEKRQAFYSKQDEERRKFESDVSARRDEFNDAIKEDRKNYDDMTQNLRSEFRQEYPEYKKKYDEWIKTKDAQKYGNKPHMERKIPSVAAQLLGWDSDEGPNAPAEEVMVGGPASGGNAAGAPESAAGFKSGPKATPKPGEPTSDLSEFDEIPGRRKKPGQ